MFKNFALVAVIVTSLAMTGCTSSVKRPSEAGPTAVGAAAQRVILSASNPVRDVTLSLTESGKKDAAENQKFSGDTLLEHVKRALSTQSLITPDAGALATVEIRLTGVRVRSNFNAIMWGFMAGSDSIDADIVITRPDGHPADRFHVSVSYALGGLAGGQDSSRMDWMYEKFAERVLQELTRPDAPKKA